MTNPSEPTGSPPKVVILGGGYGGVYAALRLDGAARRGRIELTMVSRENFFLFQPMLAEVLSGSILPQHVVTPIRRLCRNCDFHQAEIQSIDVEGRQVVIRYPGHATYRTLPYDQLLIAVGNSTDLSAIPGMTEHAFGFKTQGDAFFLRNHLIGILEAAEVEIDAVKKRQLLTFVVAGGGYTGVEVAAEINDFIREAAGSYRHVDPKEVHVILLQGRQRILLELSEKLAQFSHRLLERRGIDVRVNTRISGATAEHAALEDGTVIPTATLVSAIGNAPNRLLDSLPLARDGRGRVIVDEHLAVFDEHLVVQDYPGVWAVGDCAAIPDTVQGGTAPPTAQYALREAKHAARNILASVRGDRPRPFRHRNLGVFVPLGRLSGAAEVLGLKLSGFVAWWLYRSYYLLQLPRLDRKVKVLIDWNLELLFRRDIVKQDVTVTESVSRAHFEPGQLIFHQGDLAQSFYVILAGMVRVRRDVDGEVEEVATLGTGEYFGEISLLEGERHSASVEAVTPVDVLTMSGPEFKLLATSSTRFGELLTGIMRQRLRDDRGAEAPPG